MLRNRDLSNSQDEYRLDKLEHFRDFDNSTNGIPLKKRQNRLIVKRPSVMANELTTSKSNLLTKNNSAQSLPPLSVDLSIQYQEDTEPTVRAQEVVIGDQKVYEAK